ncbi:MAG: sugar phosphate isomerase/epimerase family protein [Thermomicrobiales bacterium]
MQKTLGPSAIGIKGVSLQESIELASATGFDSVLIDIREVEKLANDIGVDGVKERFANAGVKPASWNSAVAWTKDEQRDDDLKLLPKRAAIARDLGTTRATTGVMPGSNDRDYAENYAWTVERLRPVAEVLKSEGCQLGIEFISPKTLRDTFKYEFIYTLGGTMELAASIGAGNVGLLLDAWHLYESGGDVSAMDQITAKDVIAVHVNDAPAGIPRDEQQDLVRALPMETGVIDIVPFMRKLQELGYDGPVMAEPFSKRLEEIAAHDPVAAARETKLSLDKLWAAALGDAAFAS